MYPTPAPTSGDPRQNPHNAPKIVPQKRHADAVARSLLSSGDTRVSFVVLPPAVDEAQHHRRSRIRVDHPTRSTLLTPESTRRWSVRRCLVRSPGWVSARSALECGSPMPLSHLSLAADQGSAACETDAEHSHNALWRDG